MLFKVWRSSLLLLLVLGLTSCAALKESIKKPEVSVQKVNVTGITLSGMDVAFVLAVKNPNPLGITLDGLSYKLDIEDKKLLSGKSGQKLKLAANGSSSLTLPLSLAYKEMFDGASALVKQDKVRYALGGEIDFGLFKLPYKTSGTLDIPSLPKVSIGKLRIKRVTLSGLDIEVGLDLKNSNRFPLRLQGINYDLKVANATIAHGKSLAPVTLGAGKQGRLALGMSLGYRELSGVISRLKGGGKVPVAFEGKMKMPGLGDVPLRWRGDVSIGG
jgi:LEA14-like dessication related protein